MAKRATRKATITGAELEAILSQAPPETDYIEINKDTIALPALASVVVNWTNLITAKLQKQLEQSKASGGLSASAGAKNLEVNETTGAVSIDLVIDDYYVFVNDGRTGKHQKFIRDKSRLVGEPKTTARMPPFEPISKWIRFKGVKGLSKSGLGFRTRQTSRVADKLKKAKLVDMIRWGIYNNGIAPTYFFTNVVNQEAFTALNKAAAKALGKDIAVNIKFDYKKK